MTDNLKIIGEHPNANTSKENNPDEMPDGYYCREYLNERTDTTYRIKWDGCCEFTQRYNGDDEDTSMIHICDLGEFLDDLIDIYLEEKDMKELDAPRKYNFVRVNK